MARTATLTLAAVLMAAASPWCAAEAHKTGLLLGVDGGLVSSSERVTHLHVPVFSPPGLELGVAMPWGLDAHARGEVGIGYFTTIAGFEIGMRKRWRHTPKAASYIQLRYAWYEFVEHGLLSKAVHRDPGQGINFGAGLELGGPGACLFLEVNFRYMREARSPDPWAEPGIDRTDKLRVWGFQVVPLRVGVRWRFR
jgi:hypothetical protein